MDRVRRMAIWLGCVFPVERPIKVVWSDRIGVHLGECAHYHKGKRFEIRLRKRLNAETALSTLVHEWAHARTMLHLQEGEDYHGDNFWLTYGAIERAWQGGGSRAAARLTL
jgi:SprT-like family